MNPLLIAYVYVYPWPQLGGVYQSHWVYPSLYRYWRKLQIEKRMKAIGQFRKAVNSITAALSVVHQFKEASMSSVRRLPSLIMRLPSNSSTSNTKSTHIHSHNSNSSVVHKSQSRYGCLEYCGRIVTCTATIAYSRYDNTISSNIYSFTCTMSEHILVTKWYLSNCHLYVNQWPLHHVPMWKAIHNQCLLDEGM